MPFSNITGQKDHDWLSIGMSEVFTTKLGRIPVFQLVERNKLSEALKEIELGQTGLIDESTAPKAGEMMGAEQLVTGSFQVMGPDIRIDSRLMEVETTKILVTAGPRENWKRSSRCKIRSSWNF
jgi:TolB-like protein